MIEAYLMAWNEEETIALSIKHYQKFCDKVILLDNFSDDETAHIGEELGCEIRRFGKVGQLDDNEYIKVKNTCYWNSPAKYVIVCDCDEILYHPNIKQVLEDSEANIFNTHGFDIFSESMPVNDFLEIQTGQFSPNYCKKVIFSPKVRINFRVGAHVCHPLGRLFPDSEVLTLFHYRNIGGYFRLSERHKIYRERMSANNLRRGLGCHYLFEEKQRKSEYFAKFNDSIKYSDYNMSGVDPFFI